MEAMIYRQENGFRTMLFALGLFFCLVGHKSDSRTDSGSTQALTEHIVFQNTAWITQHQEAILLIEKSQLGSELFHIISFVGFNRNSIHHNNQQLAGCYSFFFFQSLKANHKDWLLSFLSLVGSSGDELPSIS